MNQSVLQQFASSGPHINIKADTLFEIGSLPVTNSMLLGIVGYSIVIWALYSTASAVRRGKQTLVTRMVMMIYEMLLGTVEQVLGDKKIARQIAPLSITLFLRLSLNC
jgi:F-type H+-transporting ATPase subunit a